MREGGQREPAVNWRLPTFMSARWQDEESGMPVDALDSFRNLLDHFDASDRPSLLAFFREIQHLGPPVVEELASRVLRPTAPRFLRLLTAEAAFYHPWPEWIPVLDRLLRHELDTVIFYSGTEALGRIPSEAALAALQELAVIRATPQYQNQVADVLARSDPAEAFRFHMGRLLEGSQNPGAANEAAHRLAGLLQPASLEPLKTALQHPDLLIFRHALHLITLIATPESAAFLAEFLAEAHADALEDRRLKALLADFRLLTVPAMREAVMARLDEEQNPEDTLRTFLLELQDLVLEGKAPKVAAKLREAGDELHLRARRLGYAVDTTAEGLSNLALQGCCPIESALPYLEQALQELTGRDGTARALARLVAPEDQARLDLLLDHPDPVCRLAALEILGERREEALRPALLKGCRDSIQDHAQRALVHLGHLEDPERQALDLLASSQSEERSLALRFIALHRLRPLAPDLVAEIQRSERIEWHLALLEALGALQALDMAPMLLDLLHSGQPQALQTALAETLRDMADPDTARALGDKVADLKQPHLHVIAVQALVQAQAEPAPPMEAETFQRLQDHLLAAWNDRNPWPFRLRMTAALEGLRLEPPSLWAPLAALIQECLAEKRPPQAWTPEDLARMQQAAKAWARAAGG